MDGERLFLNREEALPDIEEGGCPCVLGYVEWSPSVLSCSGFWSEQVDIDGSLRAVVDRVIQRKAPRRIVLE